MIARRFAACLLSMVLASTITHAVPVDSAADGVHPTWSASPSTRSVNDTCSLGAPASAIVPRGNACSLLSGLFGNRESRFLMVGPVGAGKSTILHKFRFGDVVSTTPSPGFDVETVAYKNIQFTSWDLIGAHETPPLGMQYFHNTRGIIFVVDSADREGFQGARVELQRLLSADALRDAPLLVFANKQDLPGASSPSEVADALSLRQLASRTWYLQPSSAVVGDGLYEGLVWLVTNSKK